MTFIIIIFLQLMIFVDYAGSIMPAVTHSAWNGLRLADYVMPFFLFIAGVSLSFVYKVSNLVS
jgi:heparan-alpha-glucosaminide N-acetyltransferase